jgi:xylulokinase
MVDFRNLALPALVMDRYRLDPRKLPPFRWPVSSLGKVTRKAASVTGLKPGTDVIVGGCDVNAEAMSLRAVRPGDMILVFGSTLSVLLTTDEYLEPEGFVPGMSLLENTYRIGAATSSGGKYLKWFRERLDRHRGENITPSNIPTGIMILPYLDGARTPFNDPEASAAILGLKSRHSGEDIFRAVMESLGYELDLLFTKMAQEYPVPPVIDVTGGLSNDGGLMRIISNITGKKLRIHRGVDASFGDALLAMMRKSSLRDIDEKDGIKALADMQEYVEPDPSISGLYEPLRRKYRRICGPVMDMTED